MLKLFSVLVALTISVTLFAADYRFQSKECQEIQELVTASLEQQNRGGGDVGIEKINTRFKGLIRADHTIDDLLEVMYLLSVWRLHTKQTLMAQTKTADAAALSQLLSQLSDLGILLSTDEVKTLAERATDPKLRESLAMLVARNGSDDARKEYLPKLKVEKATTLGGPAITYKEPFAPIKGTRYKISDWLNEADEAQMGRYRFTQPNEVEFRNVRFRAGDFVLIRQNFAADGLNTSFSDPRQYFTHSAMVVFLTKAKTKVPAVFEIHEKGWRVVPLDKYVSRNFSAYVEVMRLKNAPATWEKDANREILELLKIEYGYDFQARDIPAKGDFGQDKRCVTCSSMGDLVLKKAGIDIEFKKSAIPEKTQTRLKDFGLEFKSYLSPTDYLRTPAFEFVGFIDNDDVKANVARELLFGSYAVTDSLGYLISNREVDFKKLPFEFALKESLARSIIEKKDESSEKLIRALGLTPDTFPRVPARAMAFILTMDPENQKSFEVIYKSELLKSALEKRAPFSIHQLEENSKTKELLRRAFKTQLSWFKPLKD